MLWPIVAAIAAQHPRHANGGRRPRSRVHRAAAGDPDRPSPLPGDRDRRPGPRARRAVGGGDRSACSWSGRSSAPAFDNGRFLMEVPLLFLFACALGGIVDAAVGDHAEPGDQRGRGRRRPAGDVPARRRVQDPGRSRLAGHVRASSATCARRRRSASACHAARRDGAVRGDRRRDLGPAVWIFRTRDLVA